MGQSSIEKHDLAAIDREPGVRRQSEFVQADACDSINEETYAHRQDAGSTQSDAIRSVASRNYNRKTKTHDSDHR